MSWLASKTPETYPVHTRAFSFIAAVTLTFLLEIVRASLQASLSVAAFTFCAKADHGTSIKRNRNLVIAPCIIRLLKEKCQHILSPDPVQTRLVSALSAEPDSSIP